MSPLSRLHRRARVRLASMIMELNKQAVTTFEDLMFNRCRPAEAIELYAGATYVPAQPSRG
jgi:hypothetical protein